MNAVRSALYALRILAVSYASLIGGVITIVVGIFTRATTVTYVGVGIVTAAALAMAGSAIAAMTLDRKIRSGN